MIQRFTYSLFSLAISSVAFLAYSWIAVPLIEPQAARALPLPADGYPLPGGGGKTETLEQRMPWFSKGDWELEPNNKRLETPQGILILQSYRNQTDGTVLMEPCTMVFLAREGSVPPEQRIAEAIVLQAPNGAVLQLDEPLDLKKGRIGKLIGGRLRETVTIRSANRAGPEDDLEITTSNIDLAGSRLTTDDAVDYRMGATHGHGRRMRIELAQETNPNSVSPSFTGVKSIELLEEVWMQVAMGGGLFKPAKSGRDELSVAKPTPREPQVPVEVSCRGRFRFDLLTYTATFVDQVRVVRANPPGASDQLHCQQLSLFFSPKPPPGTEGDTPPPVVGAPAKNLPKLQFERLSASGFPVVLRSPSRQMEARGDRLDWDETIRTIRLAATAPASPGAPPLRPAYLLHNRDEIWSDQLECQLDEDGQVKQAKAAGVGSLRAGQTEGSGGRQLEARWKRELVYGPQEESRLISILGDAALAMPESGRLSADEVYVWLVEQPRRLASGGPRSTATGEDPPKFRPQKLAARGTVTIESKPMTGQVGELQLWFDHREPPTPALEVAPIEGPIASSAAPSADPVPDPGEKRQEQPATPNQRFDIGSQLLRARLIVEGKQTQVGEAWAEGKVEIREFDNVDPEVKPVYLSGAALHLINDNPRAAQLRLTGVPAHFRGQGMTLEGAIVNLDRGANRMWIDGGGLLALPPAEKQDGQPLATGGPLEVRWQGGMTFDGRLAQFKEKVTAKVDARVLRTDLMQVTLSDRIDFNQPSSAHRSQKAEVEKVFCPNAFQMDSRTVRDGKTTSLERVEARHLTIHQPTSVLEARGPGWLSQVRQAGEPSPGLASAARRPVSLTLKREDSEDLSFLHVRFQEGVTGNTKTKELTFNRHVECLHGPVSDWNETLSADDLHAEDVWLRSDKLTLRQMTSGELTQTEMDAADNVQVRSREFSAWGGRLTYSQAKDLLILEGDGRTDAQLWRQQRVGGSVDRLAARKIYYWPSTRYFKLEQAAGADLNQLTGDRK